MESQKLTIPSEVIAIDILKYIICDRENKFKYINKSILKITQACRSSCKGYQCDICYPYLKSKHIKGCGGQCGDKGGYICFNCVKLMRKLEFGIDLCADCIERQNRSGCDKCVGSAIKNVGKKCGHCKLSFCAICRKCCNPIDKIMGYEVCSDSCADQMNKELQCY